MHEDFYFGDFARRERWKIVCRGKAYVTGQRDDHLMTVPIDGVYNAQMRVVRGLNDADGNSTVEERMMRVSALDEFWWAFLNDNANWRREGALPDHEAAYNAYCGMALAFGPLLTEAITKADKEDDFINAVRNAVRGLKDGWSVMYEGTPEKRTKHKARTLHAIEYGRRYFHENRRDPTKAYIRKCLEKDNLGIKKDEDWRTFWIRCGLDVLED
jgi:hypothetical protein